MFMNESKGGHPGYSKDDIDHMRRAMHLSLGVGFLMFVVKIFADGITGSAAILSDAAESVIHVLAVSFAAFSLSLSLKPPDKTHLYGHERISFFSAGFEGAMIMLAAFYIIYEAIRKWMAGLHLENLSEGTFVIVLVTVINAALGSYLVKEGRKYHSIVLDANGKHVLTDSWTSAGVVAALILTQLTGWLPLDPIFAIVVAGNILWTGGKLIAHSVGGLMDEADPQMDLIIRSVLQRESEKYHAQYHGLRHRKAGNRVLVEFHFLFHQDVPIAVAHETATKIEEEIHKALPIETETISHLEPIEGHDEVHTKLKGKEL